MRVVTAVDISGALQKLDLNKNGVRSAVAGSLNKTITAARRATPSAIQGAGYNMSDSDIKAAVNRSRRASPGNLNAELRASGKPLPLIKFSASQDSGGVSVNVRNGRKLVPHVFIATMPSGHKGVFERVGRDHRRVTKRGKRYTSGLPIKELYGPSVKAAFGSTPVRNTLADVMRTEFDIDLVSALQRLALR